MAKGPQNDKTGARAQAGSSKSTTSKSAASKSGAPRSGASKANSAKPAAAKKPARKAQPKRASSAKVGSAAKPRTSNPAVSKAALKAAFEKAMQGRGLDEAEDAFDAALEDLYGEELAEGGYDALGDGVQADATATGNGGGFSAGLGGGFQSGEMGNLLDFYSRMLGAQGTASDNQMNDMTQGFSMVLGSGPAFAALESMLSNVSAQGAVLMNAVQTQRQLDQIGLCCTSECVKQLMSLNNGFEND